MKAIACGRNDTIVPTTRNQPRMIEKSVSSTVQTSVIFVSSPKHTFCFSTRSKKKKKFQLVGKEGGVLLFVANVVVVVVHLLFLFKALNIFLRTFLALQTDKPLPRFV